MKYIYALFFSGGIILVLLGMYLIRSRETYAKILEGGGFGLMYLTTFAAFQLYHVLTPVPAFLVLIAIVGLSGIVALLQDAKSLAVLGILGGFLAPLLISTEANSHVVLFSYYLLLNIAILGLAWFKTWRELNLIGFIFTFIVSALWGYRAYQPEFYHTTQTFLIIFFLFYVLNSFLFAAKSNRAQTNLIDTAITFGAPIIAFGLQIGLVKNIPYGMAYSSFALCLFYVVLAAGIYMLQVTSLSILRLAFTGLAVLFGTLTIPLALTDTQISSAWALESIVLLWFGMRQNQSLTRLAAALILLVSNFLMMITSNANQLDVFFSDYYLSGLLVVIANLICAYLFFRSAKSTTGTEINFAGLFFLMGFLGWYYLNLQQIYYFASDDRMYLLMLMFIANTSLVAWCLFEWLKWDWLIYFAILLLPAMIIMSLPLHPFDFFHTKGMCLAWIYSFAVWYFILYRHDKYPKIYLSPLHLIAFMFLTWFIMYETSVYLDHYYHLRNICYFIFWGFVPAVMLYIAQYGKTLFSWPLSNYRLAYEERGGFYLSIYLTVWFLISNFFSGDLFAAYPYIPFLNSLDLTILLALGGIVLWLLKHPRTNVDMSYFLVRILSLAAFIWFNAILLRTLHYWLQIPYSLEALWHAMPVQIALSIFWTFLALIGTFIAARYKLRDLWFIGFGLIIIVIIKLFIIDLSATNALERIITFIGVGILLLINGYVSPLPPKK